MSEAVKTLCSSSVLYVDEGKRIRGEFIQCQRNESSRYSSFETKVSHNTKLTIPIIIFNYSNSKLKEKF